jgi:hypothetical protein
LLEAAGRGIYWAAGTSVLHCSGGEGGKLKYSRTYVKMQVTGVYIMGVTYILLCKILSVVQCALWYCLVIVLLRDVNFSYFILS